MGVVALAACTCGCSPVMVLVGMTDAVAYLAPALAAFALRSDLGRYPGERTYARRTLNGAPGRPRRTVRLGRHRMARSGPPVCPVAALLLAAGLAGGAAPTSSGALTDRPPGRAPGASDESWRYRDQ